MAPPREPCLTPPQRPTLSQVTQVPLVSSTLSAGQCEAANGLLYASRHGGVMPTAACVMHRLALTGFKQHLAPDP